MSKVEKGFQRKEQERYCKGCQCHHTGYFTTVSGRMLSDTRLDPTWRRLLHAGDTICLDHCEQKPNGAHSNKYGWTLNQAVQAHFRHTSKDDQLQQPRRLCPSPPADDNGASPGRTFTKLPQPRRPAAFAEAHCATATSRTQLEHECAVSSHRASVVLADHRLLSAMTGCSPAVFQRLREDFEKARTFTRTSFRETRDSLDDKLLRALTVLRLAEKRELLWDMFKIAGQNVMDGAWRVLDCLGKYYRDTNMLQSVDPKLWTETMSDTVASRFPGTLVLVIDITRFVTQRPLDDTIAQASYEPKEGKNAVKLLAVSTTSKRVVYFPDMSLGNISDREIMDSDEKLSEFFTRVRDEAEEEGLSLVVLADRGFTSNVVPEGVMLITPPSSRRGQEPHWTAAVQLPSQFVAPTRITIENVFGWMKWFRVFIQKPRLESTQNFGLWANVVARILNLRQETRAQDPSAGQQASVAPTGAEEPETARTRKRLATDDIEIHQPRRYPKRSRS